MSIGEIIIALILFGGLGSSLIWVTYQSLKEYKKIKYESKMNKSVYIGVAILSICGAISFFYFLLKILI